MELFGLLGFVLILFGLSWVSSWFLYGHGCTGIVDKGSFDFSKVQESIRSMRIRGMEHLSSERGRGFQPGEESRESLEPKGVPGELEGGLGTGGGASGHREWLSHCQRQG